MAVVLSEIPLSVVESAIKSGDVSRSAGFAYIKKNRLYKPLTIEQYAQRVWGIGRRAFYKAANGGEDQHKHRPLVYFVRVGEFWKVGTSKCFNKRLEAIQVSNPHPVSEAYVVRDCGFETEREIHSYLRDHHYRGEWYALPDEIVNKIREKDLFEAWL